MTTTDPRTRLNEIKARADAASEGPWFAGPGDDDDDRSWIAFTSERGAFDAEPEQYITAQDAKAGCEGKDAEFIAHARTDVDDMVAALTAVLDLHRRVPIYEWCGFDLPGVQECELGDDAHIELSNGEWGHANVIEAWTCDECHHDTDDYIPDWPCATVRAITDALGGDRG